MVHLDIINDEIEFRKSEVARLGNYLQSMGHDLSNPIANWADYSSHYNFQYGFLKGLETAKIMVEALSNDN